MTRIDNLKITVREIVTGRVAIVSAIVTAVATLLGFLDPLIQLVSVTSGTWFPIVATVSAVAPIVEAIPTQLATQVFAVGAFIYIAVLLDRFAEKALTVLRERKP